MAVWMAVWAFLSLEQDIESEGEREDMDIDIEKGSDTWWLINVIAEVNMTTRPAHILSDLALKMRYFVIQISIHIWMTRVN